MPIYSYNSVSPKFDSTVYIHDTATVIGNCQFGACSSVWPSAVIRADNASVDIGSNVNVQDGAIIHVDVGHPVTLKDGVSIGHGAIVHGATIGENSLLGMNAVVLNDAVVGKNCIIGANALVPSGKVIPDNSLVIGSPGKVLRQLTEDEIENNKRNADTYTTKSAVYKTSLKEI